MYNIKYLGLKRSSAIRLKTVVQTEKWTEGHTDRRTYRQTHRLNRFRNVLSKTFRMIYNTPTEAEN